MLSIQKLLEITDIFPSENYTDRLDLIKDYKKSELLSVLAAINCFPGNIIQVYYSEASHLAILEWLFLPDQDYVDKWAAVLYDPSSYEFLPVFHRAANLVAMEEIILNNFSESKDLDGCADIEAFVKYYLSINSLIIEQQKFNKSQGISELEDFISGVSATNELNLAYYPDQDIVRYKELINYLSKHEKYGKYVEDYFKSIGVTKNMYGIWGFTYIVPIQRSKVIRPQICTPSKNRDKILLARFSGKATQVGQSPLETINIKKNPFWDLGNGTFLLLDIQFLVDKSYSSFIYDLWFDHIKPNGFDIKHYLGEIGYFFEEYVAKEFKNCHPKWKNPPVKATDELKTKVGKQEIELADIYLRQLSKVLVGQTKVSAINSKDRYTYDQGGIFRVDKNAFYKTFGVTQLIENTINYLVNDPTRFDLGFPQTDNIDIYPVVIVNERLLLNPTINLAFQLYFIEQMKIHFSGRVQIPTNPTGNIIIDQRFNIKPITILYISELELLRIHISNFDYSFWDILDKHFNETSLLAPITVTINRNIGISYKDYLMNKVYPLLAQLTVFLVAFILPKNFFSVILFCLLVFS